MNVTSPYPIVMVLLCALATAALLLKASGPVKETGRFVSVDGLRGYLALFVFICHSCVWFTYLRSGAWENPPSQLFVHLGQSSVGFFFMITGFLFFLKVSKTKLSQLDWLRLFVSRFLRLAPVYLLAVFIVFAVVLIVSKGTMSVSIGSLLRTMLMWLCFTAWGAPDLNGVKQTSVIVASVTWSLVYEWYFYLALPAFALVAHLKRPYNIVVLIFAAAGCAVLHKFYLLMFFGGIAAAMLIENDGLRRFAATHIASALVLVLVGLTVNLFPSGFGLGPIALMSVAFILIACGNSIFGTLHRQCSLRLGEMAYGIYLTHGILLFVMFRFVIGFERAAAVSPAQHWLWVCLLTPPLLVTSALLHKFVELPAMLRVGAVTLWLRKLFAAATVRGLGRSQS